MTCENAKRPASLRYCQTNMDFPVVAASAEMIVALTVALDGDDGNCILYIAVVIYCKFCSTPLKKSI